LGLFLLLSLGNLSFISLKKVEVPWQKASEGNDAVLFNASLGIVFGVGFNLRASVMLVSSQGSTFRIQLNYQSSL
jgi:hypothetical protein